MTSEQKRVLRCYMNWLALDGLPQFPDGPLKAIRDAGYDGVQFTQPLPSALLERARGSGLGVCGSGRVNQPTEAFALAKEARANDLHCATVHLGWGFEDDEDGARLIDALLDASAKYSVPLYPETHRATLFQDPWRTVQFIKRFPELRFNADFSHWYTGCEMVYGGFEAKLKFIRPLLDRVAFMHGRIGNPGCIQVDIGDGSTDQRPYVTHFRSLWSQVFSSFLSNQDDRLEFHFVPELLGPSIYYARLFSGQEESDRWAQSLVLVRIARECFSQAQRSLNDRPSLT